MQCERYCSSINSILNTQSKEDTYRGERPLITMAEVMSTVSVLNSIFSSEDKRISWRFDDSSHDSVFKMCCKRRKQKNQKSHNISTHPTSKKRMCITNRGVKLSPSPRDNIKDWIWSVFSLLRKKSKEVLDEESKFHTYFRLVKYEDLNSSGISNKTTE